jgi:hypothetical protein
MEFKNIKSEWENQPLKEAPKRGLEMVKKKVNAIKNKQKITNIVLTITVLVIAGFFMYISAYKEPKVRFSLLLMMGAVVIRIVIEIYSRKKLRKLSVVSNLQRFKKNLTSYYKKRKVVHYIITPLLIFIYSYGFVLLLPFFKASLSSGFYNYIKTSSIVLLVVFCSFIYFQIKKELLALKELQQTE